MPHLTSKTIFEAAGLFELPKSTRNDYLRKIENVKKKISTPVLTKKHKQKQVEWARKYSKQDFNKVIWTDKCRATLNGPDGWQKNGLH